MKLLRAIGVLALCLALQVGLAALVPAAPRWIDLLILPPIWYAIRGNPRAAMLVGCAAGLLEDAWFEANVFGLNGFRKTALGWALGAVGTRFDLNQFQGRFTAGVVVSAADALLGAGLRAMLQDSPPVPDPLTIAMRAGATGVLVLVAFGVSRRFGPEESRLGR